MEVKEIEIKTLLTKDNYENICEHFNVGPFEAKKQINYYFENNSNDLKKNKSALRIREKGDTYELTLKVRESELELLEINQDITKDQAKAILSTGVLVPGDVLDRITTLNIDNNFNLICDLTTYRVAIEFKGGELAIDKSEYNGITDYEIEYEMPNTSEEYINNFKELLSLHNIEYIQAPSKIKRAMNSIKK